MGIEKNKSSFKRGVYRSLVLVLVLVIGVFVLIQFFGGRPENLGLHGGKLSECPSSPNCVCSQSNSTEHAVEPISYTGSTESARERVRAALLTLARVKIITEEDHYLYAEVRSALFRFVDDVEIYLDENAKLIHFRSASRAL